MSPYSPVNASFNRRHRRSYAIDMRTQIDPASDWTASPTLVDSDSPTPMDLEALENIMAAAVEAIAMQFYYGELRCDPPRRPYSRGHQDRLASDLYGWRHQYRAIRDIEERDKRIEEHQARIEALEAEMMRLKQDQVVAATYDEEQDLATTQELDDIYQLILDMEHDVKAAESTRVELKAKYTEERERYLAVEAALEAERRAIFKHPDNLLQAAGASGLAVLQTEEQQLCKEFSAIRDDVDALRAEVNAIKTNAEAARILVEEKDTLRVHVRTLEEQLCRNQLLAAEDRRTMVAEITRLTAERDDAWKIADQYARQLQSSKDVRSIGSHGDDFTTEVGSCDTKTTVPQANSSDLREAVVIYRSLSMELVESLILERDLLQEQKTKIENEKAVVEFRNTRFKGKLREADRRRQDDHKVYCTQLAAMKATVVRLTHERDAAIDAQEHLNTTAVDIPRPHERTRTIKASMAGSCQGGPICDVNPGVAVVDSSGDGWISGGDDFQGTSAPLRKSVFGDSQTDGDMSLESSCAASIVTPSHDAEPGPEESLGDVSPPSFPGSASMHLVVDPSKLWQHRTSIMVAGAVVLDYLRQSSTSSSPHLPSYPRISDVCLPGLSDLVGKTSSKCTGKCGLVPDPLAHRIRNELLTRTANNVRDSSNHRLPPPPWSELRPFEPP